MMGKLKLPTIFALSACLILAYINSAEAFFFIFIPGSAIDAIGDAITGATGDHCVKDSAVVGDKVKLSDGSVHEIQKLSGTSPRCQNSQLPIRALLGPAIAVDTSSALDRAAFGINLPTGWASVEMTPEIRAKGYLFQGINRTIDAGLLVSFLARNKITNVEDFVQTRKLSQEANLRDANSSRTEKLKIQKHSAWQFYTTGITPSGVNTGKAMMYQSTIIMGKTQIVEIKTWAYQAIFEVHKNELSAIGKAISGL
jgi:hypothetical protein